MEFTVEFYETVNGRSPVREFLDELKQSAPDDFAAVLAGLARLRDRRFHREPLTKALNDGLFELRHVGKLNTRVLWFFVKGRRIIAVHGIRNKGRAIPARDLETARERIRDWKERNVL
jgi:phage-related protein